MPDFDITDAKGRTLTFTGDTPPNKASIDAAFAKAFPNTFMSRVGEGVSNMYQGTKGLVQAGLETIGMMPNTGALDRVTYGMVGPEAAKKMMDMPNHPIKTVVSAAGGDPDAMVQD